MEVILEPVATKLIELIDQEVRFLCGVNEDVQLLRGELSMIKAFLTEVDPMQKDSKVVRVWLNQIKEEAYNAEDVIEKYIFEVAKQQRINYGLTSIVKSWILCTKQMPTVHIVGMKIQDITKRLNQISNNREKYRPEHMNKNGASSSNQSPFHAEIKELSMEVEGDIVGMENEAQSLVKKIIAGDAHNSIFSLIGMGGIGKTTLAKKIYHCDSVKNHFDYRLWVNVSQSFSMREILVNIMVDINCRNIQDKEEKEREIERIREMDDRELRTKLSDYLRSKRYLVVLDDVWAIKDWDVLEHTFPLVENGGKVLLTSRSKDVAMHANPQTPPYEIRVLNDKEAWDLFCKKVFMKDGVLGCPSDLEELGKKIVKKCGGLPLAVAVLGGILRRREKSSSEWQALLKRMKWELFEGETQIQEILALSYNNLPYYLKPCFLYFSVFPEDFKISASKLILLWVAEGFIEERGEATKEETAEEYLKELVRRSLVQIKQVKCDGKVKSCGIHDLLRDFCVFEARKANFVHVIQGPDKCNSMGSVSVRRQSLLPNASIHDYISQTCSSECLRTILTFKKIGYPLGKTECKYLFGGFKLLRVIDLVAEGISYLPKEIGNLIHLRYLGLKDTGIKVIPSSMRHLSYLETLEVTGFDVKCMPHFVWKLPRLRHLLCLPKLRHFLPGISLRGLPQSNTLQTLRARVMGNELDESFGNLIHLRKLVIKGVFNSRGAAVLSNSIAKMEYLRSLDIVLLGQASIQSSELVLAGKRFLSKLKLWGVLDKLPDCPPQLSKLVLSESSLASDPFEELQHLPNLRILELLFKSYTGTRLVCSAGGFPRLEFLEFYKLPNLEEWEVEEGALPRLSHLRICKCDKLRMLPEGLRHIKTLNKLELLNMGDGFNARMKEGEGADYYKIQHVGSVIIKQEFLQL